MINEIHVRTNKAEYNPGEDICGAIYLRIINPTAGRGIRISFCGYEKDAEGQHVEPAHFEERRPYLCLQLSLQWRCKSGDKISWNDGDHVTYEYKNEGREDQFVGYDAQNPYIKQDVVLHELPGPLTIGNRIYPFKINLPVEIPGTFKASGETEDIKWNAVVEYILEIQVINAIELNVKKWINIDQSLPRNIMSSDCLPQGVSAQFEQTKFLLFTDRINTTARLQNHIHRTGGNMQLRVIITNNSSITVQSLHIQLLRKLILMCRRRTLSESQNDENVSGTADRVFLCPEDNDNVHIEQFIDMTNYQRGLDNIQIPLRNSDGTCIVPAVRGLHVKCEYTIKVVVTLSNLRSYDMIIPVAVIQTEKNTQWSKWRPPDWLAHDDYDIIKSDSIFGVPDGLLHTESFSTIPGFQPL